MVDFKVFVYDFSTEKIEKIMLQRTYDISFVVF